MIYDLHLDQAFSSLFNDLVKEFQENLREYCYFQNWFLHFGSKLIGGGPEGLTMHTLGTSDIKSLESSL